MITELSPLEGYDRVRARTPARVNERIDERTVASIRAYAARDRDAIKRRLAELEREWDVDRAVFIIASLLGTATSELAVRRGGGWRWLLRTQFGFLAVHALSGWCPPVSVVRRLGFRTTKEIEVERRALLDALARERAGLPFDPSI
jgi:hypothetical protein